MRLNQSVVTIAASLLFAIPAPGFASTAVRSTFPVVPFRMGATWVEVGFEVDGPADQLVASVTGQSPSLGRFASLSQVVINRDRAGAVPFHVLVPLSQPLPTDGVLEVRARPVGSQAGGEGELVTQYDAAAAPPAFAPKPVAVRLQDGGRSLIVDVFFSGPVASATLSLIGVSSEALRRLKGSLHDAQGSSFAFAETTNGRPAAAEPGHVAFSVPVLIDSVPVDGVVVADVSIRDPFGRALHTSAVEFTSANTFDQLLGLSVHPRRRCSPKASGSANRCG